MKNIRVETFDYCQNSGISDIEMSVDDIAVQIFLFLKCTVQGCVLPDMYIMCSSMQIANAVQDWKPTQTLSIVVNRTPLSYQMIYQNQRSRRKVEARA
jgi:hypothetical protein